jgi:alkanesulfonate monooxygenase SsuD/methylene tetrahydromethanopterin reductase-like flavin-dependent oxidoreductase (luciferase family)
MAQSNPLHFGVLLHQFKLSTDELIERAQLIEEVGFDSCWVGDHMWASADPAAEHPECLTLLTALLAHTSRIRMGPLVICYAFRNPAYLAKALSTIDNLGHGRLEIGLGIGWKPAEFDAYGWQFLPTAERLRQLDETVQILKLMFTQPQTTFKGRYYSVTEAFNSPKPVQKPHPPITIAGTGEKMMLRLVAKHADWWNLPGGAQDKFDHLLEVLKEHCRAVGRDFNTLRIGQMNMICLGRNQKEVDAKVEEIKGTPFEKIALRGTPEQIVAAYRERAAKGITGFITQFTEDPDPETIKLFANEVIPALR